MWTATLELDPLRAIATQLLGRFWREAYFSSFAPFQMRNLPRPALPAADWVRVRNRLAGVCGSDLHMIYLDGDPRIAPAALPGIDRTYPGHEVVGEVIEVGDEAQTLRVGDNVVLQHRPNCLSAGIQPLCRSCAAGNYNLCERGVLPGPASIGGGWSEEMLLHEQQLFRIPNAINQPDTPQLSDEQAALLEPSAVATHAVLRCVPQAGNRVLIIGAGTIGLLTLQAVRALAPQAEVSVMARHAFQVEQATRMGATHIIYPQDSYKTIQQATGAQLYQGLLGNKLLLGGYDVIFDTVGSKSTIHNSLRWARARGSVVLVGVSLHLMSLDLTPVWYQEVNLIGTMAHGAEEWPIGSQTYRSTFEVTADLIEQGLLYPEQLITHRFALNDYRHALLTAMDKGKSRAIKVVFDYALQPPSVVPNVRAAARQRRPHSTTSRRLPDPAPIEFSTFPTTSISPADPQRAPSVPLTPTCIEEDSLTGEPGEPGQEEMSLSSTRTKFAQTPRSHPGVTNDTPDALQSVEEETDGVQEPELRAMEPENKSGI
ncbi:MAG: alcohol dehydrogenase catalytic domain-containing protein [Chloroflexota bacterium]|nr:alcohol dehydrogenase catalytic domain-containing protein [Chloroflexota bacterium]